MKPRLSFATARDARGATLPEFAILLAPLLVTIMGLLELGYSAYIKALMQGALQTAARDAAIAVKTPAQIDADVKSTVGAIVAQDHIDTELRSYYEFTRAGKPEKLTDDRNGNGKYDLNDCYEDANDNGAFDEAATAGRTTGGNADEVIAYTVIVDHPRILPVAELMGMAPTERLSATTMLRNQPFAKNVVIRIRCN